MMDRKSIVQYFTEEPLVLFILSGLVGGSFFALIISSLISSWVAILSSFVAGFGVFGGMAVILISFKRSLLRFQRDIENAFEALETELKSSINLRPLTIYPLKLGNTNSEYAANAHFLENASAKKSISRT